jgi:hypothetical protein
MPEGKSWQLGKSVLYRVQRQMATNNCQVFSSSIVFVLHSDGRFITVSVFRKKYLYARYTTYSPVHWVETPFKLSRWKSLVQDIAVEIS